MRGVPLREYRTRWLRIAAAVAALAAPLALDAGPAADASPSVFAAAHSGPATRNSQIGMYFVRGLDRVRGRLFLEDFGNGAPSARHRLLESDDWAQTFSDRGLPAGVNSVSKVLTFKSQLLLVGRDSTTGRVGVYRAVDTPANQPLQWSGRTLTLSAAATAQGTDANADSKYVYIGEYGDPKRGPRVYRSGDGVHWRTVLGPMRGIRHVHGIAPDPYSPGDVWMTTGDGTTAVYRSRRYGAHGSWRIAVRSSAWQSVQISFSRSWVYLAADTHSRTFFVVKRHTQRPRLGTPQYFAKIPPPGSAPGTRYLFNAYFGAVDPSTGIYYSVANDDSEGQTGGASWQGLFAVRRVGGPLSIVDPGGLAISMNGEVFVGGGRIWSGQWSIPALH